MRATSDERAGLKLVEAIKFKMISRLVGHDQDSKINYEKTLQQP